VRGPQPELARDYDVLLDERVAVSVTANYHRKRVHLLPCAVMASRLRLIVKATHGISHARVFEIRAY
jgi:hypothetical protein